ncbi:MAG: hypothetical protein GY742_00540 [Hyphomicrobiales bacterium]|nr:hypothetical protein [Hyphomicrobiales bacterium]
MDNIVIKVTRVEDERIELNDKQKKARRARNIAIALLLGLLVVVFYFVTVLKFGPVVLERTL